MSEMRENGVRDVASNLQMYGVLAKKSFTHNSNKWAKRFFVLKDGFLFYYADNERKDFERHQVFNMHPKGVIPLGNCNIEPKTEPGHPFSIIIRNDTFSTDVMLAAESDYTREKWLTLLKRSSLVTWHNVQLSDNIIHQYEIQGLQMAKEKQLYFDKLQTETLALHDEKQRTEELERVNDELEKEKLKMEELMGEMKTEYEKLKVELDETSQLMKTVEDDKKNLHQMTEGLQRNLESLEQEKKKTLAELQERQNETAKLSQEKNSLSLATESLTENLRLIEEKTQKLLQEKAETETRMKENEERAEQLEEEKKAITDHALGLKESMKDLAAQNALTEAELKEEILARLEAERRLKDAEASLGRIEHGICSENTDGKIAEDVKEEMMVDVKSLKHFFEKLAFEAKLDSDKPVMVKNTIHARKSMVRRAKTMKYEACMKNRRSKDTDSLPLSSRACYGIENTLPLSTVPNQSAYSDAIYRRFCLANIAGCDTAQAFRHSSMDIATLPEETSLY